LEEHGIPVWLDQWNLVSGIRGSMRWAKHCGGAADGKQLAELHSPDGLRVITARIWDVSEYQFDRFIARDPGRDFTCNERRQYLHEDCTYP
jgi:hypothetical protein